MWRKIGPAGGPGPQGPAGGGTNSSSGFGPSGQDLVQAVATDPPGGWTVIGAFFYTVASFTTATYEAIALVSNAALVGSVRLFDQTAGIPVPGSTLSTSSLTEVRLTSGNLFASLTSGHIYQFQAEATGGSASTDFIEVREAKLIVS